MEQHHIVARRVFQDGFFLAGFVVADDFLLAIFTRVEFSVRAEHQSVGFGSVLGEDGHCAVEFDLVDAVVGDVCEEDLAF